MTTDAETDINLKTLQRMDSNIVEIVDNASQVAIYKYDSELEKWDGTDVEGSLFLYRRSIFPCHGFIIVNRMNTTNFVESITSDMQFQLQEPYLLYKNNRGEIIGSWFYERKDLQRISKKIQKIVLKQCEMPRRQRCASASESVGKDGGQDIMALLSQAHVEYIQKNTTPLKSTPEDINSLNTLCAKDLQNKSAMSLEKSLQRSMSHDPVSPRRRFLSAGSFEGPQEEAFLGKKNGKEAKLCLGAPTRLSSLFSQHEIGSPVSDVEFLQESPPQDYSKCKTVPNSLNSIGNAEWKKRMGSESDTHVSAMKQSLKTHIQESPKMMLQIHEAYISSLRSVFNIH
ncbi:hypothetical protein JTE90_018472 [Oedothorax gibbosus]|uniref:mRNA-decapping enzyme 1A n=1 Tax=Oedothorax gibbosus TaxID=931172 RepID=A0AAV6UG66_9ARAC|nr:hypothetical protein JTE90_018472 [Oedothorax gibbosus]